MKKLLVMLICLALSLSLMACDLILPQEAVDFVDETLDSLEKNSEELSYKFDSEFKGYVVMGIGNCTDTNLRIPSEYNGYPVVAIGSNAFFFCCSLVSVTIPDSVITIGSYAFYNCDNLTDVTIPDSVTNIGAYAFYDCDALCNVIFEDPTGWWYAKNSGAVGGTAVFKGDLESSSIAAEYLKLTYYNYYWFKN